MHVEKIDESDAEIAPLQMSPKPVTKKMVTRRTIATYGLHEAPHMGVTGENDYELGDSQLLGVFNIYRLDLHTDFASSNQPLSGGGLSQNRFYLHRTRKS